jgi:hypothetical protein
VRAAAQLPNPSPDEVEGSHKAGRDNDIVGASGSEPQKPNETYPCPKMKLYIEASLAKEEERPQPR